jgi:uncharacterized protein (TIGR02145 family)
MNRVTSLISKCLLFSVVAFIPQCADIPDELRDEAEGKCGGRAYNAQYEFCVNGWLYDFCSGTPYNPSVVSCCNNHQYTLSTEFCSGSYVYRKCGGEVYDPETQGCLSDVVEYKCGTSLYYSSTQFCYENSIYSKCNGSTYYPSDQRCQNGVVVTKCWNGSNYYNSETQFCIDNKVYDKCYGQTYAPSSQRCGTGGVIETGCGSDWYNSETQFCAYDYENSAYSVYSKCNGQTYTPSSQRCENYVVETKCGGNWYNFKTRFCYKDSIYDKCNGQSYTPTSQRCGTGGVIEIKCGSNWFNPATYTQYCKNGIVLAQYGSWEYAGQTYRTVEIGTQVWMAQNLNYNASNSKCNGDNTGGDSQGNCAKYGRLYNWSTAMGIDVKYNSEYWSGSDVKHRGICPMGWHLPSDAEWITLTDFVGGVTKLKAASGWNDYNEHLGNGTDEFGFSALPGGCGGSCGFSDDVGYYGHWWNSTEGNASDAYRWIIYNVLWGGHSGSTNKFSFFSVRCVQDKA